MVGVPGRSKGCSTCRRRKKKCDLKQPTCDVCAKGKLLCGGYQREMIVVQVEGGKGVYKPQAIEIKRQAPLRMPSIADMRTRDLNRAALETKCFTTFWDLYIPKDKDIGKWGLDANRTNALARLPAYTSRNVSSSDKLRCALLALSISKIGRANQDRAMIERGMELYGKSLSQVTSQLRRQAGFDSMEMLVTCRLLALYEQLNDTTTSAQNWHGHVNGLLHIVKLLPPEVYSVRPKHDMFLEARYDGAVAALVNRKSTFLSSPEWMIKPFKGLRKNVVDTITDILLQLSEVLEEFDTMSLAVLTPETNERAKKFKTKCWKLDERLQTWYCDFITRTSSALRPQDLQRVVDGIRAPPPEELPDMLAEYGLVPLFDMVQYWTACSILYSSILVFYRMFPSTNRETVKLLSSPRMDIKTTTLCIARSIKHFLRPDLGLAAAVSVTLPISCLSQTLYYQNLAYSNQHECPKFIEIQNTLEEIGTTAGGFWISSFVDDMFKLVLNLVAKPRAGNTDNLDARCQAVDKYDTEASK
ncbi:hypothetical protein K505DRAFT_371984 [Melanomma pulvis-pyrius CBS 109.77]|uniref:Zn(2)-C6 fungal-type domain-containing protein n=1 Tax=Melanomma pulvis-pyrius CBS 109.77 TaxID=1314802 RepID=A0A6A6XP32_9PLEO|nr:hypothetical protein K505DRAFT_371984 [Melanomma pulvis-pyrius CBS 109.77]